MGSNLDSQICAGMTVGVDREIKPNFDSAWKVYFCSLFVDTKEERNALMQHVYPQLSDYCRDKHGLQFQVSILPEQLFHSEFSHKTP